MAGRYPILDGFTVTTPSLSVVIRADDTPLPSDVRAQPNPANLVTAHAVEIKESVAPGSEEARARATVTSEAEPAVAPEARQGEPSTLQKLQEASILQARQVQQQRLFQLQNSGELSQSQLKELKDLQAREESLRAVEADGFRQRVELAEMLGRASSKHADALYNRFGAPPPIKPLDAVVTEGDSEGFIKRVSTYETKDFTYWDKLRRHNTETIIRRWHTYVPTGEEDTAFFERNIEANVPSEAYMHGIYYKQLDIGMNLRREYKLPTESYVAPPVYVRRRGNPAKRVNDPIRQVARNLYGCSTCSTC
ncbi:hypothetical protein Esti_006312 [Eimeria stiedai]